jgi:hypothetical protein
MLVINVGDVVYLTKNGASITDTVTKFIVGENLDGDECVLGVRLKELGEFITLNKENRWSPDAWAVEEVNNESPNYTSPEQDLIDTFPSL